MGGFVEVELTFLDAKENATSERLLLGSFIHDVKLLSAYFEASKLVKMFSLHRFSFTEKEIEKLAKNMFSLEEEREERAALLDLVEYFCAGNFLSFIKSFGLAYYADDFEHFLCQALVEAKVVGFC